MNCPECDAKLNIPEDAAVGEIVSCPDCGADYEISKKEGSNIELKQAESVGEDWGEKCKKLALFLTVYERKKKCSRRKPPN